MKKHVILLADLQNESAWELMEILRSAGMVVSSCQFTVGLEFHHELSMVETHDTAPIAIVCLLAQQLNPIRLREIVQRAAEVWPSVPLVACPRIDVPRAVGTNKQLIKAGFRAVAESPAQLPVLLREVEESPGIEEELETFKALPARNDFPLPASLRKERLRQAFDLIASLHLASNQKEAAAIAVERIAEMVPAERWSIFVADNNSRTDIELDLVASQPHPEPKADP